MKKKEHAYDKEAVIGHVYFARKGLRLAEAKNSILGFRQLSIKPSRRIRVKYFGSPSQGMWMDILEAIENYRSLSAEMGGGSFPEIPAHLLNW
ncbi:hypothetical protein A2642_00060 [Candidatus Nomurabacteria bacterium RIFCSPHIGHO2_01_FULL_39_10]|uniref:Uncharacterized protein n=1 Tax=Candidatus Nomurabacteria bacterium RIFCSPHIGHO2_01_FULL_39_10 TaxID=1801733 RepID=A0A1F6VAC5_9BACT|nr:MAG: hypothetical protein A2642_00060 [Candidatus Nomurabacteria bacterium RIFCSPHIGHO2_01_FULL_39_10]